MNALEKLIDLTHKRMSAEARGLGEAKTIRDLSERASALNYFSTVFQLLVALQTLGAELTLSDEAIGRLNIYKEGNDELPKE